MSHGNVLLVQFVSDTSVTSDGFMATYRSIPRGSKPPTTESDVVTGPRIESRPRVPVVRTELPDRRVKPEKSEPRRPVVVHTEKPTTTTTVPPTPKPKPARPVKPQRRPVNKPANGKPTRTRGQSLTDR